MANKNEQGVLDNETLIKSEAFFDKNKKAIIIAVLAIIIIVVGGFLYKAYAKKRPALNLQKARNTSMLNSLTRLLTVMAQALPAY